jgi:hypothetical integral membrane protein (TIGR02206 family)
LRQFSDAHLAALAVLAIALGLSVWTPRRYPGPWIVPAGRTLALVVLAAWAGEYAVDLVLGTWTLRYSLPLQLTDLVSVVSILALWTRRPRLVELVYFWSLTASLQALLTPDLARRFPSAYYFTYFVYHIGAVVAACFLVLGCRLYPKPGAVWRVFVTTLAFTAVAGLGDILTGGNYMYLRQKPAHNSLLNLMGPWPWYILSTVGLALALLLAVNLLTKWIERRDRPLPAPTPPHPPPEYASHPIGR